MAENPKFNNSDMFKNVDDSTHNNIDTNNNSEVLATQGNVINSIKTFWNNLRTKLAYAISRHDYGKQVGGDYVPIFVNADGVVQECQPITIQADIASDGIITISTNTIPNDNIYTGTTVCIKVLNNSVSGSDSNLSNLQIKHNNSTSPVKYPSGVTVLAKDMSNEGLLLATFCKNSTSSSNNFWILLNKINTVVSTGQTTSNDSGNGGHPGLMTAEDKAKLDTIAWSANNYSLPKATDKILGGIKLGYTTNENDKNYKLETDTNGNGYVNVPWTVYSLPTANKNTLGGVKSKNTGTTEDRYYDVQVNSDGTMKVNVPWTDTTYTLLTASSSTLGGVKLGADRLTNLETPRSTSDAGRYYPIQTDKDDKLVVNVPWTDNNSHDTARITVGTQDTTQNNQTNGQELTYINIIDNENENKSHIKVKGEGGTEVSSNSSGELVISSPTVQSYNTLKTDSLSDNNNISTSYLVFGPGKNKANTSYYLAGNGTWVNGILVPIPTVEGKTLKSHANGTVSWE